jgi:hypothetical protein
MLKVLFDDIKNAIPLSTCFDTRVCFIADEIAAYAGAIYESVTQYSCVILPNIPDL